METKKVSELIYDGHVIKVTVDQVVIDDELEATRECVYSHGGVAVLALHNHKILLVKQYRYVVGEYTIEVPAGKLEANESMEESALRELEEETGYTAIKMNKIFDIYSTPGFCGEVLHLYEAVGLSKVDQPLCMDEDERIDVLEITLEEAGQMLNDGRIKDSKTMIAIQYALMKEMKSYEN